MKIYITNKTKDKLKTMFDDQKGGLITVRKYNKEKDKDSTNIFKSIKLSDNQRASHKAGKSYTVYINKDRLNEVKKYLEEHSEIQKEGGFLPLIPLIIGGIAALGSIAGGTAGIVKAVSDSKFNAAKLEEEQRHNKELEAASRGEGCSSEDGSGIFLAPWKNGMGIGVKEFVNGSGLDAIGKKSLRNILKNLSETFKIERKGEGLYLYNPN